MFIASRLKTFSIFALCVITFAALAPLLASFASTASAKTFVQEICSKNGERFLLSVVTTKGNKISTLIDVKSEQKHPSVIHQFDHCPFCSFATEQVAITTFNFAYLIFQQEQSQQVFAPVDSPALFSFFQKSHPTRAPPIPQAMS